MLISTSIFLNTHGLCCNKCKITAYKIMRNRSVNMIRVTSDINYVHDCLLLHGLCYSKWSPFRIINNTRKMPHEQTWTKWQISDLMQYYWRLLCVEAPGYRWEDYGHTTSSYHNDKQYYVNCRTCTYMHDVNIFTLKLLTSIKQQLIYFTSLYVVVIYRLFYERNRISAMRIASFRFPRAPGSVRQSWLWLHGFAIFPNLIEAP